MRKIYIHHYYSESFFLRLFHNTTNRVYVMDKNIGYVNCEYNNTKFNIIFNPLINDNDDGVHLLDTFAHWNSKDFTINNATEYADDFNKILEFSDIIKNKKGWETVLKQRDAAFNELCNKAVSTVRQPIESLFNFVVK